MVLLDRIRDNPSDVKDGDEDEERGEYWEVIGGQVSGGLVVRTEADPNSPKLQDRLACGARIRELETLGGRMLYYKLDGGGPSKGWISMTYHDKPLLQKQEFVFVSRTEELDVEIKEAPSPLQKLAAKWYEEGVPPPREPGMGCMYEVVYEQVRMRTAPNQGSETIFGLRKGQTIEVFDWDETCKWRMAVDYCNREGWVMLDHPHYGPLMRPKGIPFQKDPLDPVCAAAMQDDLDNLKRFTDRGMGVNNPDAGGLTPLMIAARADHVDCVLLLLIKKANAAAQAPTGRTAVELAGTGPTKALILALTHRDFDPQMCNEAVSRMRPDMQEEAQDKLKIPMRMQIERLQGNLPRQPQRPASAVSPPDEFGGESWCVVATTDVPVRIEPNTEAGVLTRYKPGTLVTVIPPVDATSRWVKIKLDWTDRRNMVPHNHAFMMRRHRDMGVLLERV